jgi:long-chain acyl-CoA synthetase
MSITWTEVNERVDRIAAGLIASGVCKGDVVSILGQTCLDWALCDLAILRAGGVSVGIYPTLTGEQAGYILKDSSTRFLFVEDADQFSKLLPLLDRIPSLRSFAGWQQDTRTLNLLSLSDLEEKGLRAIEKDGTVTHRREEALQPGDVALLVYTSGTTGPPKGARLTHRNVLAQLDMLGIMEEPDQNDVMMFFLPLAHVGERIPGHYNRIYRGVPAAFVEDFNRILDDIQDIRPTVFGSVPRIFEKAYARIRAETGNASPLKRRVFTWSMDVGRQASRLRQTGSKLPAGLRLRRALADQLVYRKIHKAFGGRARYFISAAAPISVDILEFFHASGLLILEGYGQTEVSCFCTLNRPDDYRLGSVGKALPGIELQIAEDSEILVRGPTVFQGYHNQPELSAETLMENGWVHTGDLGRLDEDGFLWIIGRKKEIIITSGGKNVTPSNIENLLMTHPLVEHALVHGDRRKYLTALLGLDTDAAKDWAIQRGISCEPYDQLIRHPALLAEIQGIVDGANKRLARYETIKRFAILPRTLQLEQGELTPTLKIRRKIVEEHHRDLLDSLYSEAL